MTQRSSPPPDRPALGIVLVNVGIFLWTVHDAISKWLTAHYPVFELLFVRSVFALPILALIIHLEQGRVSLATTRAGALIVRGLLSVGSFGLFLYGLKLMSLGTAFAIGMSAPLMVAALAGPLLGEPPTPRQWLAVLIGFVAVLLMIRPGGGIPLMGALVMLVSTVLFALSLIMTRALGRTERAGVMTFYVSLVFLACGAIVLPFVWITPSGAHLLLMATAGCLAAVALYCTTQAFRLAPVSLVVSFEYIGLVWAVLIGFWVWGDVPSRSVAAGAVVIVVSGLYLALVPTRHPSQPE